MGEYSNGNGAARFGGKAFSLLDGTVIMVPEFNLDEAEAYILCGEASGQAGADRARQQALVAESVAIIHRAIARNHPDLTLQQLREGLGFRTGRNDLFSLVNEVNGLVVVSREDPPSADQPAP